MEGAVVGGDLRAVEEMKRHRGFRMELPPRQREIDKIAAYMPIKTLPRDQGQLALITTSVPLSRTRSTASLNNSGSRDP